jgi:hypothetical protein
VSNALEQTWSTTSADSEYGETVQPPAGWLGIVQIASARAGVSKKGETYLAVDLKDESGQFSWPIYKQLTTNGVAQEGKVKSAKITLRQLGIDQNVPFSAVESLLKAKVGHWFAAEQKASNQINQLTGAPYVNTDITGVASPPVNVAQPVQNVAPQVPQAQVQPPQPSVQQDGMTMTTRPVYQFPPAVAGTPPTVVGQNPVAAQQAAVQQAINSPGIDDVPFS